MTEKMIKLKYPDALKSPYVPLVTLIESYKKPDKVYKYQVFYDKGGKLNRYWKTNVTGETFRLNVASSFEDQFDFRPQFDRKTVIECLKQIYSMASPELIAELLKIADEEITEERLEHIVSNYKNSIYIGCLTASSSNEHMWEKYANDHTGYCIEYCVHGNELLSHNMLPVIYEPSGVDLSYSFCLELILEAAKRKNSRTLRENLRIYSDNYAILLKQVYIPVFIKDVKWKREEEYRLFLLPHFKSAIRMVKANEEMDLNQCINLEKSVSAVHLGMNFDKNPEADKLLHEIENIIGNRNISLFQRKEDGTEIKLI